MVDWRIRGTWNESCYAPPLCPAYFGAPFCEDFCQGILAFHVSEGHYGDVDLADTKTVLVFKLPAKLISDAFGISPAMLYLDEKLTPEQAKALEAINKEVWEAVYGPVEKVKQLPIKFEKEFMDDGLGIKRFYVEVPDILHFGAASLVDKEGKPTKVVSSPVFGGTVYVGKATEAVYKDPDASFNWTCKDTSVSFFEFDIGPGELWHPIS